MSLTDDTRLRALSQTGLGPEGDEVLDRFTELVQLLLEVPVSLVSMVDGRRQFFPGQVGLPEPWASQRQTPLTHSFCQHVVVQASPLIIEDARLVPLVADNLAIPDLAVIAYAGMPLTDAAGNVLGSLCAISDQPKQWSPRDLLVLENLANACSAELRLRLSNYAHRRALSRVALLAEVTRSVGTTLEVQEVLDRLVGLVVPALGDWATAGVIDETGRVRQWAGRHRAESSRAVMAAFTTAQAAVSDPDVPIRRVLRTGEPESFTHPVAATLLGRRDPEQDLFEVVDTHAVLTVPVGTRGHATGYLMLGRGHAREEPFTEEDRHDAIDIGRRAGMALLHAEQYERERSTSQSLQRYMLTRLPEPDHLQVVARYESAVESARVGGDWYDAFQQPDGAMVFVVGDVTGHDIDAAAMMGQVRNLLRGTSYDREEPPAALLTRVDRVLRGLDVNTLATVLVARMEQTEQDRAQGLRTLRWSSAGHPPPILVEANGQVRALTSEGELLLGVDPETDRTDHTVVLQPDSTVLLYTDGLVERRGQDLDVGIEALVDVLRKVGLAPLDALCDEVLAQLLPDGAEDDVVVLAVRATRED